MSSDGRPEGAAGSRGAQGQGAEDGGQAWVTGLFVRVRSSFIGGVAAALSGVVVLGLGGRIVMFLSRLLHPDAVGRLTEGGNRIGEFTVGGTIALVLFGGLLSGLLGAVVWVLTKQWLPSRHWVVGLAAMTIGGPTLILSDNRDFTILAGPGVDIVLLLAMVFGFGAATSVADKWLDRRLPASDGSVAKAVYSVGSAFGLTFVPLAFRAFLTQEGCFCSEPNIATGLALLVAGLASVTWWGLEVRGSVDVPHWLRWVGTASTWGAVAAGSLYLAREIAAIL